MADRSIKSRTREYEHRSEQILVFVLRSTGAPVLYGSVEGSEKALTGSARTIPRGDRSGRRMITAERLRWRDS